MPYDEQSVKEEQAWLGKLKKAAAGPTLFGMQTRPCGPTSVGPWVILTNATGDLSSPPSGNGTLERKFGSDPRRGYAAAATSRARSTWFSFERVVHVHRNVN